MNTFRACRPANLMTSSNNPRLRVVQHKVLLHGNDGTDGSTRVPNKPTNATFLAMAPNQRRQPAHRQSPAANMQQLLQHTRRWGRARRSSCRARLESARRSTRPVRSDRKPLRRSKCFEMFFCHRRIFLTLSLSPLHHSATLRNNFYSTSPWPARCRTAQVPGT